MGRQGHGPRWQSGEPRAGRSAQRGGAARRPHRRIRRSRTVCRRVPAPGAHPRILLGRDPQHPKPSHGCSWKVGLSRGCGEDQAGSILGGKRRRRRGELLGRKHARGLMQAHGQRPPGTRVSPDCARYRGREPTGDVREGTGPGGCGDGPRDFGPGGGRAGLTRRDGPSCPPVGSQERTGSGPLLLGLALRQRRTRARGRSLSDRGDAPGRGTRTYPFFQPGGKGSGAHPGALRTVQDHVLYPGEDRLPVA